MITVWLLVLMVFMERSSLASGNSTMSTIIENIFQGYDKKLPPRYHYATSERQVLVSLNIYIYAIFSINEAAMEYSASILIRERWVDERLTFDPADGIAVLELEQALFDDVWVPDPYIVNEKKSEFHNVATPNKLIHIYSNGTVQFSARVTGTFFCPMYLQKYPFDKQTCKLELEIGHTLQTMKFVWSEDMVSQADNIHLLQYELSHVHSYGCEKSYYGTEKYPCVGVRLFLVRKYMYHVVQVYLPSLLIVLMSWVNFWLDCTAVPARISIGVLTVLTMTTMTSGAHADLPQVSYLKAIDTYLAVCLAFIFGGLLEFACVNVLIRNERKGRASGYTGTKHTSKEPSGENRLDGLKCCNGCVQREKEPERKVSLSDETRTGDGLLKTKPSQLGWTCFWNLSNHGKARFVDKISRVLFPSLFIAFNIGYWWYYLSWEPDEEN
ncbi:GLRA1-like protein [Mya arenaria]|uniref:GLRA1-like protein n=1 Tax=Mya arenaria TaxID=6604 RepID=A0ABY7DR58_MYAAR|nr:GLRA1-like protein [Mya arenaria]